MARMARRLGLDGIALSEHFHGVGYWTIYDWLLDRYPSERGVFWEEGLALIPGAEVNIRQGAHVIVLGEIGELRRLDHAFAAPLSEGYEPFFREFLDVTEDFDVARIGAHIFPRLREPPKFPVPPPPAPAEGAPRGGRAFWARPRGGVGGGGVESPVPPKVPRAPPP